MVVTKYLTILFGKYPANLYRIPDSAGWLNFTGYRYLDPAHPYPPDGRNFLLRESDLFWNGQLGMPPVHMTILSATHWCLFKL
jgi:hypothetical protein